MSAARARRWQVETDEEGPYIVFAPQSEKVGADASFIVYLPENQDERDRAIDVIVRALNRAKVFLPREKSEGGA